MPELSQAFADISDGETKTISGNYTLSSSLNVNLNNATLKGPVTVTVQGNPDLTIIGEGWEIRGIRWDVDRDNNVRILPRGGPWKIANCAWDGVNGTRQYLINPQVNNSGTDGILENCWFGDGVAKDSSQAGGWWNESAIKGVYDIRGRFIVRGCYFYQNGGYIAATAPDAADTHTGSHHIENSFFKNCYLAQARMGTPAGGTCTAQNSTFVFDGDYSDVPGVSGSGVKRSRGLWFYWNKGVVEGCDLSFPNETAIATGKGGSAELRDCQVVGGMGDVTTQNVGDNPSTTPPSGCVTSVEEAVSGSTTSYTPPGEAIGSGENSFSIGPE